MSGTVHELFANQRSAEERDATAAPALPLMPHVVDLVVQIERIRAAAENALTVLRVAPTATNATDLALDQIMDAWSKGVEANRALAHLLECKGQA